MPATLNIQNILSQVRRLDKGEQFSLLERLVALIRKSDESTNPIKLTSISGLGSEVWEKTNIDQYIEQERQW
jgi:hypothetical protein